MTLYTKIKILLITVLAIIISVTTYKYLTVIKQDTTILIAAKDIPERTIITSDMVEAIGVKKREKDILAPDSVSDLNELKNAISIVKIEKGKTINIKTDVISGTKEWFLENKILNQDGTINNKYFLADNQRIITIRLDSQGAVNNKLKKWDWVDVIYTNTDGENSVSINILQHVQVFDIQEIDEKEKRSEGYQNISLSVTSQQAVDLTFAKRKGKIDLILNPEKGQSEPVYPSNLNKLISPYISK